jgi:hypothetical protein
MLCVQHEARVRVLRLAGSRNAMQGWEIEFYASRDRYGWGRALLRAASANVAMAGFEFAGSREGGELGVKRSQDCERGTPRVCATIGDRRFAADEGVDIGV